MRKSKYGNKFEKRGGTIYDSKMEARYSEQLELRRLAGEIKEIHPQHCLRLDIDGNHICKYYVDFRVVLADGSEQFHEVKGFETDVWRIKWKMALAIYGKEKFVLIK
jgi:hypothetical protein